MTLPETPDPREAWEAYRPGLDVPWDEAQVAHLHRRAGLGATWGQLRRDVADGFDASLRRVLDGEPTGPDGRTAGEFAEILAAMEDSARRRPSIERVQLLWLFRLLFTPHALAERMTLMWHGHYATSNQKVNDPLLMLAQNLGQRELWRAPIGRLHLRMLRDPAMLLWLDGVESRKGHPNENLPREFLELFALGEGNYAESDIREIARALTGYREMGVGTRGVHFEPVDHDDDEKVVLGEKGAWGVEDVVRVAVARPAAATHIAGRLYRTFISDIDEPPPALIEPLAETMRTADDIDIGRGIERILRSRLFHSPWCRGRKVKGPVEYAIGALRACEEFDPPPDLVDLEVHLTRMGQRLFYPPNVAGWPEGLTWLRGPTLLARANFAASLASSDDDSDRLRTVARRNGFDGPQEWSAAMATLLLGSPRPERAAAADRFGPIVNELLILPEAQLC